MPRRNSRTNTCPEIQVQSAKQLQQCVSHLQQHLVIGLDTEFVGEDTFRPELCLIQVSTTEQLYVIDPYSVDSLDDFWKLLHDPARTTVVHAGREEIRICRDQSGQAPGRVVDVQIAAGLVSEVYPISYANLVHDVLGHRLHKAATLTDWRKRPLTASQMKYAFDDVRYLLPIWVKLTEKLAKYQRVSWAEQEYASFSKVALGDNPHVERWKKLKGIGGSSRQELAVIRQLFQWREKLADRQNRPVRTVLRDDLLIEIARRGSYSPQEITGLRGIPKGETPAILEIVRHTLEQPESDWPEEMPTETDPPQVALLAQLLMLLLNDYCERHRLAVSLVSTLNDLKTLVRCRQKKSKHAFPVSFESGWRQEVILPFLKRFLDGQFSIRVRDVQSRSPLEFPEE